MDTHMLASPHMAARFELTNKVHEPFTIRNRNNQIRHVSIDTPIMGKAHLLDDSFQAQNSGNLSFLNEQSGFVAPTNTTSIN